MAEPFVINAELKSPAQINARLNVGIPGKDGKDGASATVSVGTVTIGEPDEASVENVGTESAAVLDFVIPRGPAGPTGPKGADGTNGTNGTNGTDGAPGAAATVTVGTVTTGEPGTAAQVTNSGTENAAVLDFVIPRGAQGQSGSGTGDMTAAVYDPAGGARQVAFADALTEHTSDADIHVTAAQKTAWSGKQDKLSGAAGQVVGFDADGNAVAQAASSGGSSATQHSLTLTTGGWYTDGSYRAQQVTVSGLKASYDVSPDVDCELSGTDADGDAAILEGWALVHYAQTGAGTITFKCCGDAPTVNIPVVVRVFE